MFIDDLRKLLKENGIHFFSYWKKQKLIEVAKINDLLPKQEEEPEEEKQKYTNYERLKNIRHTPTKIIFKGRRNGRRTYISIHL